MDFEMHEEEKLFRSTVRDFSMREIAPRAQRADQDEILNVELAEAMGEVGLFSMLVPEEYGGANVDYVKYCGALEELARIDMSHAVIVAAANSLGVSPICRYGSAQQRDEWLLQLGTGKMLAAFGPARLAESFDPVDHPRESGSPVAPVGRPRDNGWVVNGRVPRVLNAASEATGVFIIQVLIARGAETCTNEISTLLIPRPTAGVSVRPLVGRMGCRAAIEADIVLDQCQVPCDALLGGHGEGSQHSREIADDIRLALAAVAVGGAEGAFEVARDYAKQRFIFGRPVSCFDVNAAKLAEMAVQIEAAKALLMRACELKDSGRPLRGAACMAKIFCTRVLGQVTDEAVQLHGANGLACDYAVERFLRDCQALVLGYDSIAAQRAVIANEIGCSQSNAP